VTRFENSFHACRFLLVVGVIFLLSGLDVAGQVAESDPVQLRGIDVVEHLSDTISLDLEFTGSDGQPVKLGSFFIEGKPVILIMGYYTCPMLCNLVANGVSDVVREMPWLPGKEYQLISVSIDPRDTDVIALAKQENYLTSIGKPGIDNGWVFLTGDSSQSAALAEAIGFKYYYDEEQDQYAHAALLTVLTDKGKISRYLYGIQFKERDLHLALVEASEGKVGSTIDRILLYCYHYDPEAGSYVVFAGNVMRLGGFVTLGIMIVLIGGLLLRERQRRSSVSTGIQT
jgi:protein SCO1/2